MPRCDGPEQIRTLAGPSAGPGSREQRDPRQIGASPPSFWQTDKASDRNLPERVPVSFITSKAF